MNLVPADHTLNGPHWITVPSLATSIQTSARTPAPHEVELVCT
ncbi:hypothetical protein ACFPH6_49965 [Streptomyces xiangluensis]|uniref:Uncharacterized protein n=1 Tax=Streptomyces xiangluensis TaxID=2665720 RepID=A0ABV8Z4X5_9ACTN